MTTNMPEPRVGMGNTGRVIAPPSDADSTQLDSVSRLLEAVGIRTVIVVDDEFEPKIEDVIAVGESIADVRLEVCELGVIDFTTEREIWEAELRSRWAALTIDQQRRVREDIYLQTSRDPDEDGELSLLQHLIASATFRSMTPSEWIAQRCSLLADASTNAMLILFDKHLGTGMLEDGIDFIRDVYATVSAGDIWTGLLTNRVRAGDEHSAWEEMSGRLGECASRLIVLSKDHLSSDTASFIEGLRVLLMVQPAGRLERSVAAACKSVGDEVLSDIQNRLNPLEFERIIFGLARDEGIWEVDMLLRLLDIRRRTRVRLALHDNESVRESITLLRELDSLRTGDLNTGSVHAQRVYQEEIYDDGDHLARLQLPIELGDVFVKESSDKQFVLAGQPCDLMVRSTGRRHPDLSYVTLLPIKPFNPDGGVIPSTAAGTVFELPAFWQNGSAGWAELNRPAVVPIEAVDYCVLSGDGRSVAPLDEGSSEWLVPGWEKRRRHLTATAEKLRKAYEGLSYEASAARVKAVLGIRSDCVAKPIVEDSNFHLDLKRVRRLLPPYARALLTSYCLHVAREAFDRPLLADSQAS